MQDVFHPRYHVMFPFEKNDTDCLKYLEIKSLWAQIPRKVNNSSTVQVSVPKFSMKTFTWTGGCDSASLRPDDGIGHDPSQTKLLQRFAPASATIEDGGDYPSSRWFV